ncbi:hypothetical protein NPIL_522931 [Nephila pilipes]|uniref:Uncharacterized protein n=1 Tax=Nephila pilipes TaxID=299642 RepID=A0A8X6PS36_NEPPI|nr:hypothetical protein NPIL_522931 [Nephila pilipes]
MVELGEDCGCGCCGWGAEKDLRKANEGDCGREGLSLGYEVVFLRWNELSPIIATDEVIMTQAVSIPEIQTPVNNLTTSDQCLHADSKVEEYLNLIPQISFLNQEEKNEYSTSLYTIQEEVRSKFNSFKYEDIKAETEKYKSLMNSAGTPGRRPFSSLPTTVEKKKQQPGKSFSGKETKNKSGSH